jgi:hypothetical protein
MSGELETPSAEQVTPSETTGFLLGIFADLYRQEVAAEEDVHRTLPFFGTALGIVIGALAYAAGRLPKWSDLVSNIYGQIAFGVSAALLVLAIVEAVFVLCIAGHCQTRLSAHRARNSASSTDDGTGNLL